MTKILLKSGSSH